MTSAACVSALLAITVLPATSFGAELPDRVAVVVTQSYEYRPPSLVTYELIPGFELPIGDLVDDLLFAAGAEAVGPEEAATATIRVIVQGRAIGGSYLEPVRAFLYTGAEIAGEIVIEQDGSVVADRDFSSEIQRPFRIAVNVGYEDPANAPFDSALRMPGGFGRELAAAMADTWGINAVAPALFEPEPALRYNVAALLGDIGSPDNVPDLVEALADENDRVRWEAVWSLGRIGDPAAIPYLIAMLQDPSEDVRWFASWSLRVITGEDIGPDGEAWQAWYERNGGAQGG